MDTDVPDVTGNKEREIKLERSNRLHVFLNRINESIIRSDEQESLFGRLCLSAVENAKFSMACVCKEGPGTGRMIPVAYHGFDYELSSSLPMTVKEMDAMSCPVNSFIAAGKTFVCNEGGTKTCSFPFSNGLTRPDYRCCAAFPIVVGSLPIGAIWLFSSEQQYFGSDEIKILESLAHNISFALEAREHERKRRDTEEALWRAEKRYRSIVENISEGIYQTTRDGQFLMVNAAMVKMLGYASPVEVITGITSIRSQLYAEPARRDVLVRLMDKEDAVNNFECRLLRKDGALITVLLNTRSVRNEEGTLLYYEGSARDITDRKLTFEALKAAKDEWELTFNAVPDLIMIVDRNHRIQNANKALLIRMNLKPEKIIGKHCYEFIHGSLTPPVFCPHLRIMQEGEPFEGEIYDERLKGHFLLTISPLFNIDCTVRGTVHVFRDITDRKRTEQEAKILQARLIQANKMASLGLLVTGVAHEVNNPNNFIMFNSSLLQDAWKDIKPILDRYASETVLFQIAALPYEEMKDAIPRLLSGISDGAGRIKGIIEGLREFACDGRSCLDGSIDVNASVRSSLMILQNQIAKHTDNFILQLSDTLPAVMGSPQQIEQVIINLLMNALQALRSRKDFVMLTTMHDKESRRVIIEVQDSGMGIADHVRERITDPFFTTRLASGGTGLGLSISNSIVRDHKGALEFQSEEGKGTIVRIMLPERDTAKDGVTEVISGDKR